VALFDRIATRVGSENMLKKSSISTGRVAAERASGIVAFSAKPRAERPVVISTYFSPSAERGRISSVESSGSGSTSGSSSSCSCAVADPSGFESASMLLTTPTRAPPMRTSLPRTSPAEFGTSAVSE
jgi:hypothetical protein